MTARRSTILPISLLSLMIVGTFFFSHTTFAAPTPAQPTTTTGEETAAQYGQRILNSKDFPTNPTLCESIGFAETGGSYYYCGGTALTDGTYSYGAANFQVEQKKGDVLKCYIANVTVSDTASVCSITRAGVTSYQKGSFAGGTETCTATGTCTSTGALENAQNQILQPVADAVSSIGKDILQAVAYAILTFSNFLLGLAGAFLNYVVYYAVFKFGSLIGNSPGVLLAWGILRDIANMLLLFGFIFLGIATILNTDKFPAKKAIPRLLIFAILMNFSLFACEAVIDVANGMSSLLYSQADPVSTQCNSVITTNGNTSGQCDGWLNYGIAGHIMQSTGLASIWKTEKADPDVTVILGLAVFSTIGFIVLLSAGIMLAIRLIVLTFLMIASPIGFAGMAIPFFQKFANEWWNKVIHQAFFAPLMFLLIFISLKVVDTFSEVNGQNAGLGAALSTPNSLNMGVVLIFMLVCGFLLASVIVAHRFGAIGAQGAIGFSKKFILGSYAGIGRAAGGYAGRNTIGRRSDILQKKYNASVASGRLRFLQGSAIDDAIGSGLKKGADAKFGSSKSFNSDKEHHEARDKELRKIERLQAVGTAKDDDSMREALKKLSDAEIAESDALKKGGEQLERIARTLSSEKFDKLMGSDKLSDGRKDELRNARFTEAGDAAEKVRTAAAELARNPADAVAKGRYDVAKKSLGEVASSMTGKDLGQMAQSSEWSKLLENDEFVGSLSDDQFKDGQKNTNLNTEQIKKFSEVRTRRSSDPGFIAQQVKDMNAEAINKIKSDALSNSTLLDAMSGRKIALIDTSKIGNDDHVDAIVTYVKTKVLTDSARKASFQAAYKGDARIEKRWQGSGVSI